MDNTAHKKLLVSQYIALLAIVQQRGLPFETVFSETELASLPLSDITEVIRTLRDVLRTPSS